MDVNQIPIVVPPEDDEYIYSYICRIASLNGFKDASGFVFPYVADEYYKNEKQARHILRSYYGNIYFMRFYESLGVDIDPIQLFLSLSVYPCLSITMHPYRQALFVNSIFRSRLQFPDFINDVKGVDNRLLYCPECMNEQKSEKGYFWFKRAHQLPGVEMCYKHHKPLYIYTGLPKRCFSQEVISGEPFVHDYNSINEEYSLFVDCINKAYIPLNYNDLRAAVYAYLFDNDMIGKIEFSNVQDVLNSFTYSKFSNKRVSKSAKSGRLSLVSHLDILVLLFIVFRSYDNFNKYTMSLNSTDNSDFEGYEISGLFSPNIAHIKHECGCEFIGTPYGVKAGWGCPNCLSGYSDEQFVNLIFSKAYDSHYKMASTYNSGDKLVTIQHSLCGKKRQMTVAAVIAKRDCICLLHNNSSLVSGGEIPLNNTYRDSEIKRLEINRQFAKQGYPFELLSYTKMRADIKVRHLTCGKIYESKFTEVFARTPICPYCDKMRKVARKKTIFSTAESFTAKVHNLVGDTYELVGSYNGSTNVVPLLHQKCGNTFYVTPSKFCRGQRCKCETFTLSKEKLSKIVEVCTDGSCTLGDKVSHVKYVVINNVTEDVYNLSKDEIIQELNRVTPSDIIDNEHRHPVKYKDFDVESIPIYLIIYNDLLKKYSVGDVVRVKDIYKTTCKNKNQVNNAISGLLKNNLLCKTDKRAFYIINSFNTCFTT